MTEKRRMPLRTVTATYEMTEWDPPRRAAFRVLNGPIRAVGVPTAEPLGENRSRVTLELDFEGRGLAKLLLPLVRRDAAKQVTRDQAALKARLEAGP